MTFEELVQRRRSVRKYSDRPVAQEDILKCLEAARLAPSACNGQPWYFVVIDDRALRERVAARIFSGVYSINKFAMEAPVLVAVVSEREKFLASFGGQVRDTTYGLVDIGIACEHLVLQAQELGIESCWIGWFDEKALKEEVKIPKEKKVDIVIALGYGSETRRDPPIRKTLEEISSFNAYLSRKKN